MAREHEDVAEVGFQAGCEGLSLICGANIGGHLMFI